MKSVTTKRFRECFEQLPSAIQEQVREAYRRWTENPYHPGLRFKQVHPAQPIFSVRITLNYRALGIQDDDTMVWFWIGSHAEYDRLMAAT